MANPLQIAKRALRKSIKLQLSLVNTVERQRQEASVFDKVVTSAVYKSSQRISIFLSMSDEISTYQLLERMLADRKDCFIPRYSRESMDMVRLHSMDDFRSLPETAWHIKQPPLEEKREEALETGGLDLMFVPGLAFTREGARMGRGKGYYDTYLGRCGREMKTVGLAFREQVLAEVPTGDHDVRLWTVFYADEPPTEATGTS